MLIRTDFATYPNFPQLPLVCAGDWHGQSIGLINLSAWLQVRAILGKFGERYKARADAFATMSGLASMGLMVIGLVLELVTRGDAPRARELAARASTWIIVYVYTVVLSMIGLMLSAAAATNLIEAKQQKLMITQQRMRLSRRLDRSLGSSEPPLLLSQARARREREARDGALDGARARRRARRRARGGRAHRRAARPGGHGHRHDLREQQARDRKVHGRAFRFEGGAAERVLIFGRPARVVPRDCCRVRALIAVG